MTLLHMEEYEDAQFLSLLNKMLAMPDSEVSTTQRVNRKKKDWCGVEQLLVVTGLLYFNFLEEQRPMKSEGERH